MKTILWVWLRLLLCVGYVSVDEVGCFIIFASIDLICCWFWNISGFSFLGCVSILVYQYSLGQFSMILVSLFSKWFLSSLVKCPSLRCYQFLSVMSILWVYLTIYEWVLSRHKWFLLVILSWPCVWYRHWWLIFWFVHYNCHWFLPSIILWFVWGNLLWLTLCIGICLSVFLQIVLLQQMLSRVES